MKRGEDSCNIPRKMCCFFNTWLEKFNASVCGEQRALYEHKSKLLSVKHRLSRMDTKQIHVTVRIPGIRMSININQERSKALMMKSR